MELQFSHERPSPVVTVTLNPSIDRTLWVRDFTVGKTFLAERSEEFAGGKGVNTARALLRMGVHSMATGILGHEGSHLYMNILERDGIDHRFLLSEGRVRTNVTIISGFGGPETHIRDRGSVLSEVAYGLFTQRLEEVLSAVVPPEIERPPNIRDRGKGQQQSPMVVLSGSLPLGFEPDTYARLIDLISASGARAFLDASGEPLRKGLKSGPFFVKPNRYEVEEALGFLPSTEADYTRAIKSFHEAGVSLVMISRGKKGLLLSDGITRVSATASVDRPVNTVGSGDAAVAGAVLGCMGNLNLEETARLACAMGSANTLLPGGGMVDPDEVLRLYRSTEVKSL